jgi:hypothetical protein
MPGTPPSFADAPAGQPRIARHKRNDHAPFPKQTFAASRGLMRRCISRRANARLSLACVAKSAARAYEPAIPVRTSGGHA